MDTTVALMNSYNLTRTDLDSINELCQLKFMAPEKPIDKQVKSAFTRKFNATAHMLPFAEEAKKQPIG